MLISSYWITWVILLVYDFFPSLGTINIFRIWNMGIRRNNMEKWWDMAVLIIPVFDPAFITEFVMIWPIAIAVFLTKSVSLVTAGIGHVETLNSQKIWIILLSLKPRTLIWKPPTRINSLLIVFRFEIIFSKLFSHSLGSPFGGR